MRSESDSSFVSLWAWEDVTKMADKLDLSPPQLPRKWQPPRRIDEGVDSHAFPDCITYNRVETWYAFLDVIIRQIEDRFLKQNFEHIVNAEELLLHAAKGFPVGGLLKKFVQFYDDFDVQLLDAQLQIFHSIAAKHKEEHISSVACIAKFLQTVPGAQILLSEVCRLTKLLLVIPVSAGTAERSFSSLRRLKSYLRSTMSQRRLNHVMLLRCHQQRCDRLNLTTTAQEFVSTNEV